MSITYLPLKAMSIMSILGANTAQGIPPCLSNPGKSPSGSYTVELCPTADFSDLKNAIDFIADSTNALAGGWANATVEILLPPLSVFEFTETITINFGNAVIPGGQNNTPQTISLRAPENGSSQFINTIDVPMGNIPTVSPRLFSVIRNGGILNPDRHLHFENIHLNGNSGVDIGAIPGTLPLCINTPGEEQAFARTGIKAKGLNISLRNCTLEHFASGVVLSTSSGANSEERIDGAAIFIENGSLTLQDCSVEHNFSGSELIEDDGICTVQERGNGGAIAVINKNTLCTVQIENSRFHMNRSSHNGGAVLISNSGQPGTTFQCVGSEFSHNIVRGNTSTGGAVCIRGCRLAEIPNSQILQPLFEGCDFVENQAIDDSSTTRSSGGGLSITASEIRLEDLDFFGNAAGEGNDIRIEEPISTGNPNEYVCKNCTFINPGLHDSVSVQIETQGAELPAATDECSSPPPLHTRIRFQESIWILAGENTYATRSDAAGHTLDRCSILSDHNGPVIWVNNTVITEGDTSTGPFTASVITRQSRITRENICSGNPQNSGFIRLTDNVSYFDHQLDSTTISGYSRARVDMTFHNYSYPIVNQNILDFEDGAPACWFSAVTRTCDQDLAPNGIINGQDLAIILAYWGTPQADINCDGDTDGADLAELLARWGPCEIQP